MGLSKNDIIEGLKNAGLKNGSTVLVHSSLKSFGYVDGGAMTVINALLDTVGTDGNVIAPTLTGKRTDSSSNPPVFDVRTTPAWTGTIPETFRKLEGAKRSLHPTHSVSVIGSRRDEIIKGHEGGASPCDDKSPYYKNCIIGGYILLIGVDQNCNTTIHCMEEVADVPYHLQKDTARIYIKDYEGREMLVVNRLHDWNEPPTDFNKFDELYLQKGIMIKTKIGNSTIRLINAKDMLSFSVETLRKNPLFLLK